MDNIMTLNCPNCGGTVSPKEEKCGWCCSYVNVKVETKIYAGNDSISRNDMDMLYYMPVQVRSPLMMAELIIG